MKKNFPGILEKESYTAPEAIRANSNLPGTQVGVEQVHRLVCRHHATEPYGCPQTLPSDHVGVSGAFAEGSRLNMGHPNSCLL